MTADERFVEDFIQVNKKDWRDEVETAQAVRKFYEFAKNGRAACPIYVMGWRAALESLASAFRKVLTRDSLLSLGDAIGQARCGFAVSPAAVPGRDE
jgi:hypothetical protein